MSLDELKFWPDLTNDYRVSCPGVSEKLFFSTFSRFLLIRCFLNLHAMRTHNILNEFKLWLDWTTDCGVSCP